MCRSIRPLFNLDPPASEEEVRAAAIQFARKLGGFTRPSRANAAAFDRAVEEIAAAANRYLAALETAAPPKDRALLAEQAASKRRSADRYAR